jgi:archaellum component FlaC
MAKKLKDLVVTRVSLVPKGANPLADITLFKSRDPVSKITFDEVITGHPQGVREALWKIYDLCYSFSHTVSANMAGGKNVMADMEKSIDQFAAGIKDILSEVNVKKSTQETADAAQREALAKVREFLATHQEDTPVADKPTKKREDMSKEELIAELGRIDVERAATPPAPPAPPPTAEDILKEMKDLPPVVKQALEAQAIEIKKAKDEAAAATESARVEKEARELSEMVAYVKKELPHIPGTPEDVAKSLLESRNKLTKESYDLVVTSLKAGNTGIAKAVAETGVDDVAAALGSAYDKLSSIAKELQGKDTKLTFELAFEKAVNANPDLFAEYRQESKQRR